MIIFISSEHLNKSRVLMIEKILKMFQLIVEQPGNSSLALLPSILDFTIEQTMPLLQHDNYMDNTDLTSIIYSLLDRYEYYVEIILLELLMKQLSVFLA